MAKDSDKSIDESSIASIGGESIAEREESDSIAQNVENKSLDIEDDGVLAELDIENVAEERTKSRKIKQIKDEMITEPKQSPLGEEKQVRELNEFEFIKDKSAGIEPGVIAKRKRPNAPIAGDDASGKKYTYQWMIKDQPALDTMSDVISSSIARHFLKDNAPKDKPIVSNNGKKVLIASRFIEGFSEGSEFVRNQINAVESKLSKFEGNEIIYKKIPGMYKVAAVNLLVGNYDMHSENVGVVGADLTKHNELKAAVVDFGRGLNFCKPKSGQVDAIFSKVKVLENLKPGDNFTPTDMLRAIHSGFYQINSSMFLNAEFVAAIREVVNDMDEHPEYLHNVIKSSTNLIQKAYKKVGKEEELLKLHAKVSPDAASSNLADNIIKSITARKEMLSDLAANIELQTALMKNDSVKLDKILTENPDILAKEIKWLAESNIFKSDTDINKCPAPTKLREFATRRGSLTAIKEVIYSHEVIKGVKNELDQTLDSITKDLKAIKETLEDKKNYDGPPALASIKLKELNNKIIDLEKSSKDLIGGIKSVKSINLINHHSDPRKLANKVEAVTAKWQIANTENIEALKTGLINVKKAYMASASLLEQNKQEQFDHLIDAIREKKIDVSKIEKILDGSKQVNKISNNKPLVYQKQYDEKSTLTRMKEKLGKKEHLSVNAQAIAELDDVFKNAIKEVIKDIKNPKQIVKAAEKKSFIPPVLRKQEVQHISDLKNLTTSISDNLRAQGQEIVPKDLKHRDIIDVDSSDLGKLKSSSATKRILDKDKEVAKLQPPRK
jgi:hypothetical protein